MQLDLDNLPSDTALSASSGARYRDRCRAPGWRDRTPSDDHQKAPASAVRAPIRTPDADQLALALEDLDTDIGRSRESQPPNVTEPLEAPRDASRCPTICRARTFCSTSRVRFAAAAVARCMRSARASARCWTGCRRSFAWSASRAPNTPAGLAVPLPRLPAPERPIAGGLATPALLAQVLVSKYCDHTPLYRQSQIFARHGVDLGRSTLAGWVGGRAGGWKPCMNGCARTCSPRTICSPTTRRYPCSIREEDEPRPAVFGSMLANSGVGAALNRRRRSICMRQIAKPSGRCRISRTSRACCTSMAMLDSSASPAAAMSYLPRVGPYKAQILRGGRDHRLAHRDRSLASNRRALCHRSARTWAVSAHRLAERRSFSKPIIDAFQTWLEAQLPLVPGRSTLAEAIRYALSRWKGLTRFLQDGRIELDTNPVERAIRPVALGRKNHLFAGSDGGGHRWAVMCSLIETCKLNGVEPYAYLRDVLSGWSKAIRSTVLTNCCHGLGTAKIMSMPD